MKFLTIVLLAICMLEYGQSFSRFSLKSFTQSVTKLVPSLKSSPLLRMAVTDAPPKMDSPSMGGMFTNSSPETRRVVPANLENKTKFKIVYVVLESQYQSALTKACTSINDGKEGVAVEAVGYLLEELRSPSVFEQFKADIASANIFIGSLIFVQELADKVQPKELYIYLH